MVLLPIFDSIIFVSILFAAVQTIINNCIKNKKDKKEKDLNDDKVILNSTDSIKNLSSLYYSKDIESPIVTSKPIQKSYECFNCHKKLIGFYKKDYFAFDKEYCERCWNKINLKIINNLS